jgi:hypothetical protein
MYGKPKTTYPATIKISVPTSNVVRGCNNFISVNGIVTGEL